MINFTNASRVFLAVEPVDMRKSFNGLHALVAHRLGEDVLAGSWFVFVNRSRTRIKILVWDGTGLWVLAKRLERGRFHWINRPEKAENKRQILAQELGRILGGLDWEKSERKRWFSR